MGAEASGKAFLGVIAYIKVQYGTKRLNQIIALSGELTQKLFSEKIELLKMVSV